MGDLLLCVGMLVDVYNIGVCFDLLFLLEVDSFIVVSNVELEWEIMGYYVLIGVYFDYDILWVVINYMLEVIGELFNILYVNDIILIMESKIECIFSIIEVYGVMLEDI